MSLKTYSTKSKQHQIKCTVFITWHYKITNSTLLSPQVTFAEQNTQIRFNNVHMGTYYKYTTSLSPVISGLTPATGMFVFIYLVQRHQHELQSASIAVVTQWSLVTQWSHSALSKMSS